MLYTRNENGLTSPKIVLPLGAEMTVLAPGDIWTRVRLGGVEGVVRNDSLQ